ncbi:hypothetical protein [Segetibacter aerophilus]|uniref:Uncharacterized protein n=1 Tax=Segetibacter aerophilus TaxID=670293 RepID=A0A512BBL7_9BACT|nr:hypothetical protein [Segetibacter aerophilus]GEO09366.1 hypothetical protein SAE01_18620 [Segetibacter aerophilus]
MKATITFTYQYILFLSMTLMLIPAKIVRPCTLKNEIKIENKKQAAVAVEASADLLHGEMLFRF